MSIATEVLPTVKNAIINFGSSIKINKYTQTYVSGSMVDVLSSTIDAKAVPDNYSFQEVQGNVQVGDLKLIVANNGFTIDVASDKIEFLSVEYNIVNSIPLVFQDVTMIYELQVRK